MSELVINGRFRRQRTTGMQRVAECITRRLKIPHVTLEPGAYSKGVAGHAWEQLVLAAKARRRLIWGPCNTGPLSSKSLILTIHDAGVFDHPECFSRAFVQLHRRLSPLLARRALRIVTVSSFSRERISAALGVPKSKIEVIPNGVDESFKPASAAAIASARAAVGLKGQRYFATLATIEPRKNLRLVRQAWAQVRSKLPADVVLLVIGATGPEAVFGRTSTYETAPEVGVVFTGYVADNLLPPLLSGAMAVLYPSLYEGFGLPLLEAMACGAPTVTTRLSSLPEVGGDAPLYVDAHDASELGSALLALAGSEDLRVERSCLGRQRARNFSWDHAAGRMDELLGSYL